MTWSVEKGNGVVYRVKSHEVERVSIPAGPSDKHQKTTAGYEAGYGALRGDFTSMVRLRNSVITQLQKFESTRKVLQVSCLPFARSASMVIFADLTERRQVVNNVTKTWC